MRPSAATAPLFEANTGVRSISAISGKSLRSCDTFWIRAASASRLTGSAPRTPFRRSAALTPPGQAAHAVGKLAGFLGRARHAFLRHGDAIGVAHQLALGRGQAVTLFRLGLVEDLANGGLVYRSLVMCHGLFSRDPSRACRRLPSIESAARPNVSTQSCSDRLLGRHLRDPSLPKAGFHQDLVRV